MPRPLILLADPAIAEKIRPTLAPPDNAVSIVSSSIELRHVAGELGARARLFAVATSVIVPKDILELLDGEAYNLHPGPPERPGLFPSVFALYDGDFSFGVTVHQMTEDIDAGPIIDVERFDIPDGAHRIDVDSLAWQAAARLIARLAPQLRDDRPVSPTTDADWQGKRTTQKDFDTLCVLPSDVSQEEFERRYRAVGEGPDHALSIALFGHRFVLDNMRDPTRVVRGGQA